MGSLNLKNISIYKIIITILITSIIMATSGFSVYSMVAKPRLFTYFMELGAKYLQEGKYEEAVLQFTKAIEIERKSTQARVAAAKGYIGINDIDKAVSLLKEAQGIDIENKDLLKKIIDLLRDIDPEAAYAILMKYVDYMGKVNLSSDIRKLVESATEQPQIPKIIPEPGVYIKPVTVKLESDKVRIGHTFYYTLDESTPDRKSKRYKGPIPVKESTTINLISYNPKGKKTEVVTLQYIIDSQLNNELERLIDESQKLYDGTQVGTEPGNCVAGAKEEFGLVIRKTKDLMEKDFITYDMAIGAYDKLSNALHNFKQKIIEPTDRVWLSNEIDKAKELLSTAVEGSEVGQYRSGAKAALQEVVNQAEYTLANLLARQNEIDAMVKNIIDAIESFNAKRITEIDVIIAQTGAKIGPVTVSLLWHTNDDIDLHVTSPLGDTVHYGNKYSYSGGQLDVDRQADSFSFVSTPVENIYWDNPPRGTYTVRVNMYTKRSTGSVPIQVRVMINNEAEVYNLEISSGTITVCTFEY
ncbi:MAG TPA: hypothetical protein GXX36_03090 [Clostridiaceae bacterium]|nr:hypothetical protein [Clostridiaceae bacterium]